MSRWRRPDVAERAAFEAFVAQWAPALTALARGLSSGTADGEDLLQETLAKVLERWEHVSRADDPYLYARRMMVNTSTSTWRRRRREQHTESAEHVMASGRHERLLLWHGSRLDAAAPGTEGDGTDVLQLLRRLPPRQRAVVVLRYLEDLPDDRIAELLAVTPTTVRTTAMRALKALRELTVQLEPQ